MFDLIDAAEALQAELEAYKNSYDVKLNIELDDGVYAGIQRTKITCTSKLTEIRYTTDGTEPVADSEKYTGWVYIPYGKTVLKAAPFYNGSKMGDTVSAEYFIGGEENLAKGASVSVDSDITLNGYPIERITDGNAESRWASSSKNDTDAVVEITLKNGATFNSFLLDEFASKTVTESRLTSLKLEYQEGDEWKTAEISDENIYLVKDKTADSEHMYRGVTLSNSVTSNKIRLVMKGNSISLWEFNLYNTSAAPDKSSLNALIAECESINAGDYADSEAFEAALAEAQNVASNEYASAVDVLKAEDELRAARDAMVGSGPTEDNTLIAVFGKANSIKKSRE